MILVLKNVIFPGYELWRKNKIDPDKNALAESGFGVATKELLLVTKRTLNSLQSVFTGTSQAALSPRREIRAANQNQQLTFVRLL